MASIDTGLHIPKILVVEKNKASADALARWLRDQHFTVAIALDGLQAVVLAATEQPDLILMELGLAGLDGWDVTARLKANPETSHIPIIALSANARPNDRHRALAAGGDDFDSKPIQFDRLLQKVEALLMNSGGVTTNESVSGT